MKLVLPKYICRIIMSVLIGGGILLSAQDPAKVVLEKVAGQYRAAVPFKVGFILRQEMNSTKNHTENRGTFCLSSQNRFRVILAEQVIVYDGKWLWTRDLANHQIIVEEFNPRSNLKFIWDILNGSLSGYRIIKTKKEKAGLTVITLEPLAANSYIRSVQLKIDQNLSLIRSTNFRDFQNNLISIDLDTLINLSPADPGLYDIGIKEDEELIDLRP